MTLHHDALTLLRAWTAPDAGQETWRREFVEHLTSHDDGVWRSCRPDHLTASALVVDPAAERACLVLHAKAGLWLQAGGHLERDDATVASAALREAREETGLEGLTIDPVPVRLSRHAVPFCGGSAAHHLDVQFVAVAEAGAVPQASDESDAVGWFALDDPPEPTDDEVRALIAAASSRRRGTPAP
ncbi:MAG: NUDIX domain-containing protein [Aeromicrobium erythreum]